MPIGFCTLKKPAPLIAMLVPTPVAEIVPWVVIVACAWARTPPAACWSRVVLCGTRSSKLVLVPLYPVVDEFAMLPEMFWSANDCACRPETDVFRASKIPIPVLQLRSGRPADPGKCGRNRGRMSQGPCHDLKSNYINYLKKGPGPKTRA